MGLLASAPFTILAVRISCPGSVCYERYFERIAADALNIRRPGASAEEVATNYVRFRQKIAESDIQAHGSRLAQARKYARAPELLT